ncbi:MAG: response regulator [Bacillota bacterium]
MYRILVVDDEELLVKGLKRSLEQEGFSVTTAHDGEEAVNRHRLDNPDLVVLDIMLPKMDGLEVCREIRRLKDTPVIMLTARGEDVDKIVGLEVGADDYLTKPFNTRELIARIRAVLRRAKKAATPPAEKVLQAGPLEIDTLKRRVVRAGQLLDLSVREFELLHLLAGHPGRVFTRENLLELVWGADYYGDERTVDVYIRRLREKVEENPAKPCLILTKWGVGYYFLEDTP